VRLDKVGQEIKIGSYVVYITTATGLGFAKVEKYTPKFIKLQSQRSIHHTRIIVINPSMPNYHILVEDIEQTIEDRARLMLEIRGGG
jgi:hypothetical protein